MIAPHAGRLAGVPTVGAARKGLTLPELLVVLLVVGILVALAVPTLAAARARGARVKSLSNLRQIVASTLLYADTYAQAHPAANPNTQYPSYGPPGGMLGITWWSMSDQWFRIVYADQSLETIQAWILAPGAARRPDRGNVLGFLRSTSYLYSSSFIGDPRLWEQGTVFEPSLRRGTRVDDVHFPSRKVFFWEWELPYERTPEANPYARELDRPAPVGMHDGSARNFIQTQATPAVPNPEPTSGPLSTWRYANTRSGVRGSDVP